MSLGEHGEVRESIKNLAASHIWIPILDPDRLGLANLVAGGIDLCSIPAMKEMMERSDRFIQRTFATSEIATAMIRSKPEEHLAVCYAAREAAFKAGGFRYRDVVVDHEADGRPYLVLAERALQRANRMGVEVHLFGLSHEETMACASVVLLKRL